MFEVQLEKLQLEFKESLRESYEPLQAQIDALVARVEQARAGCLVGWHRAANWAAGRLGAPHGWLGRLGAAGVAGLTAGSGWRCASCGGGAARNCSGRGAAGRRPTSRVFGGCRR